MRSAPSLAGQTATIKGPTFPQGKRRDLNLTPTTTNTSQQGGQCNAIS